MQSFLDWQIILSYVFLGRRYKFNQLFGCFLVAVGIVITVASGSSTGSLMEAGIFWSLLMIIAFLFEAADTILKEVIFLDAAKKLKGGSMDLFVLNSYGSAFQIVYREKRRTLAIGQGSNGEFLSSEVEYTFTIAARVRKELRFGLFAPDFGVAVGSLL